MKIKEFIRTKELEFSKERLRRLEELEALKVVLERQREIIEELEEGKFKVGGQKELLEEIFTSFEERKGRGGKPYLVFDNGVKYFPKAKYGRFITK